MTDHDEHGLILQALSVTVQQISLDVAQIKTTLNERCASRQERIDRISNVCTTAHNRIDKVEKDAAATKAISAIVVATIIGALAWCLKVAVGK